MLRSGRGKPHSSVFLQFTICKNKTLASTSSSTATAIPLITPVIIGLRVKIARDALRMTQADLSVAIGFNDRQTLNGFGPPVAPR